VQRRLWWMESRARYVLRRNYCRCDNHWQSRLRRGPLLGEPPRAALGPGWYTSGLRRLAGRVRGSPQRAPTAYQEPDGAHQRRQLSPWTLAASPLDCPVGTLVRASSPGEETPAPKTGRPCEKSARAHALTVPVTPVGTPGRAQPNNVCSLPSGLPSGSWLNEAGRSAARSASASPTASSRKTCLGQTPFAQTDASAPEVCPATSYTRRTSSTTWGAVFE
jgi:hypothetical protein